MAQALKQFTVDFPLWSRTESAQIKYKFLLPTTTWNPEQVYAFNAQGGVNSNTGEVQVQLSPVNLPNDTPLSEQGAYTQRQIKAACFGLGLRLSDEENAHAFAINLYRTRSEPSLQEEWSQVFQANPYAQPLEQATALWEKMLAEVTPELGEHSPTVDILEVDRKNAALWEKACTLPSLEVSADNRSQLSEKNALTKADIEQLARDTVHGRRFSIDRPFRSVSTRLEAPEPAQLVSAENPLCSNPDEHLALMGKIQADIQETGLYPGDYQLYHGPRRVLRQGDIRSISYEAERYSEENSSFDSLGSAYVALDVGTDRDQQANVYECMPRRIEVYSMKDLNSKKTMSLMQALIDIAGTSEDKVNAFLLSDAGGNIQVFPTRCSADGLQAVAHAVPQADRANDQASTSSNLNRVPDVSVKPARNNKRAMCLVQ